MTNAVSGDTGGTQAAPKASGRSLFQFQRLSQKQNVSFGRTMQHMHVLYCHEKTSMLRIESLTPEADIAEAERKQDRVMMYHHCTGLVKPVPVTELVKNRTPYSQRGWCAAERDWSSTRAATNLSREVDAPEGEKGGLAPMVPEAFRQNVAHQLKFTHLDDVEDRLQIASGSVQREGRDVHEPQARRFGCRRTRHRPVGFGELPDPGAPRHATAPVFFLPHAVNSCLSHRVVDRCR